MIIRTKNKSYTGELSGIVFLKGEAKVETLSEFDKEWFKNLGCEILEAETDKKKK